MNESIPETTLKEKIEITNSNSEKEKGMEFLLKNEFKFNITCKNCNCILKLESLETHCCSLSMQKRSLEQSSEFLELKKDLKLIKQKLGIVRIDTELESKGALGFDVGIDESPSSLRKTINKLSLRPALSSKDRYKLISLRYKLYSVNPEDYFETTKKFITENKLEDNVKNILTPIDLRCLEYKKFTEVSLSISDIEYYKKSLTLSKSTDYIPFDRSLFFFRLLNYSLALCPIQECLERLLITSFPNVIYNDNNKEDPDPYLFYIFTRRITIKANAKTGQGEHTKCSWELNHRLESFANDITSQLTPYLIKLFRRIYYDIFNDNCFRVDFLKHCINVESEIKMILENLNYISFSKKFRLFVQTIIKTYSSVSNIDKNKHYFALTRDDPDNKKRCQEEISSLQTNALALFDSVGGESIEDVVKILS